MAYPLRAFTHRMRALVLKRAIDLVKEEKLQLIHQDQDHAHFHVENNRGGTYNVEIRLKDQEITFTHCNCPYRGIGLCKHTGAAILQLLMNDGFNSEDLNSEDFHFEDSDVLPIDHYEEALLKLIREISRDQDFDMMAFLSKQNKQTLLNFIVKYLEESEDIRMVVMAYLWYKAAEQQPKQPFLS
jgi:uncharacterized Zn finger protein